MCALCQLSNYELLRGTKKGVNPVQQYSSLVLLLRVK